MTPSQAPPLWFHKCRQAASFHSSTQAQARRSEQHTFSLPTCLQHGKDHQSSWAWPVPSPGLHVLHLSCSCQSQTCEAPTVVEGPWRAQEFQMICDEAPCHRAGQEDSLVLFGCSASLVLQPFSQTMAFSGTFPHLEKASSWGRGRVTEQQRTFKHKPGALQILGPCSHMKCVGVWGAWEHRNMWFWG